MLLLLRVLFRYIAYFHLDSIIPVITYFHILEFINLILVTGYTCLHADADHSWCLGDVWFNNLNRSRNLILQCNKMSDL